MLPHDDPACANVTGPQRTNEPVTRMGLGERTREWAKRSDTVRGWREQRYRLFMSLCQVKPEERILDVGAGEGSALERFNRTNPITAVDLRTDARDWLASENVSVQYADGTQLPFPDGSFPVVFSNSVIEHVPKTLQQAFADEIRRVGERYFVQTPNRYFPIEPHYQMPFVQFLPEKTLKALNQRFTMGFRARASGTTRRSSPSPTCGGCSRTPRSIANACSASRRA